MPYKDPEQKREWERQHRRQRLTRRRELREVETDRREDRAEQPSIFPGGTAFLLPLVAGSALAAYDPWLAIGAGALTLAAAYSMKKDWRWLVVGLLIFALGLFLWRGESAKRNESVNPK